MTQYTLEELVELGLPNPALNFNLEAKELELSPGEWAEIEYNLRHPVKPKQVRVSTRFTDLLAQHFSF